ncbi:MAG: ATP-grasp domain-containing protein, partial [Gloeomargarita sp. DG_2_bins_126]
MQPTVGVLGGGQLAWMLAQAARDLDIPLWVQTPNPNDPAVALSTGHTIAPWDDPAGLEQLLHNCDVLTFENEWINLGLLKELLKKSGYSRVMVRPSWQSLAPLLDKYDQRCYAQTLGLPVPEFWLLTPADPPPILPLVVKARRHGYDGGGTRIIHTPAELTALWREWNVASVLAEAYVPFSQELAVLAARHPNGTVATYPVSRTHQVNQICRWVYTPAPVPAAVAQTLQQHTHTLLSALAYEGLLATEWFYLPDGSVLLNEIAPRTHNS